MLLVPRLLLLDPYTFDFCLFQPLALFTNFIYNLWTYKQMLLLTGPLSGGFYSAQMKIRIQTKQEISDPSVKKTST